MPKTRTFVLAATTTGLLLGAFAATAPTASAAPAAQFTTSIQSVQYGSFLDPVSDAVVLGDTHDWAFTETPSGAYQIQTEDLPHASCLSSEGDGQPLQLYPCGPGFGGQEWTLTPSSPDPGAPVLIESVDYPGEVLEAHGTDVVVTLEQTNGNADQQWDVSVPEASLARPRSS